MRATQQPPRRIVKVSSRYSRSTPLVPSAVGGESDGPSSGAGAAPPAPRMREVVAFSIKYGFVDLAEASNSDHVLRKMAAALGLDTSVRYSADTIYREITAQHTSKGSPIARSDFPHAPEIGIERHVVVNLVDWAMRVYRLAGVLRARNKLLHNWIKLAQRHGEAGLLSEVRRVTMKYRQCAVMKISREDFLPLPAPAVPGTDHTLAELIDWVMRVYAQACKDRSQRDVLARIRNLNLTAPSLAVTMVVSNVAGGESGLRGVIDDWIAAGVAGPTITEWVASGKISLPGGRTSGGGGGGGGGGGSAPLPPSHVAPAAPRGTDVRRTRASTVSRFLFLAAADGTEGSAIATAVSTAPAAATPAALPAVLRTAPLVVPSAATPPTEPPAPATAPGFACGAKSSAPMPRDSLLSAPVS